MKNDSNPIIRSQEVTIDIVGYTILLCFSLFKTSSVAKSILGAH